VRTEGHIRYHLQYSTNHQQVFVDRILKVSYQSLDLSQSEWWGTMVCHNESMEAFVILVILVINQLNAQILILYEVRFMPLHVSSTVMFIIRRPKLYYTASGIFTPVGGRPVHRLREDSRLFFQPVHRTATYRCEDTRCCIIQF